MPTKTTATGLLLHFDEERRNDLIRDKVEGGYESFSDALSVPDWELRQLNIALLIAKPVFIGRL
jgi:hypothetical protein